jgi:P-type Ca2+ transporter type 2C
MAVSSPLNPSDGRLPVTANGSNALGWHAQGADAALTHWATDASVGVTTAAAADALAKHGRNELPASKGVSSLRQFLAQFANPIVLTLLAAACIAVFSGANADPGASALARYGDAIAIFLIVALNAGLGFYQEKRAEAALDALQQMQAKTARVLRDGQLQVIAAADVVAGDILDLEAGDAIAADARLLQCADFLVSEASLTGESEASAKTANAKLELETPLGDRTTMVFTGTHAVRGRARAIVVATATHTELGRLSTMLAEPKATKTPLEDQLDQFGKRILIVCLALSMVLFAWGMVATTRRWHDLLLEAVSVAVAAIPEGLPAITTITLALGMQRMAKRGAILRKLSAVETLGAASIVCTDKTGTLTQNEMTVREIFVDGHNIEVSGVGYEGTGEFRERVAGGTDTAAAIAIADRQVQLRRLLESAVLCTTAELRTQADGSHQVIGDPTEAALLTLGEKGGIRRETLQPRHRVRATFPFDSDRKRMTVVTETANGALLAHTKGSADVLLARCAFAVNAGVIGALSEPERARILREAELLSDKALRVLAIACREVPRELTHVVDNAEAGHVAQGDSIEEGLTFLGLVAMIDPPRTGVKEAVALCNQAQVRAVMVTGDHKLTAVAIARELGLWDAGATALSGTELDLLSDSDLRSRIDSVRVFARVTAEQKLRIVRAFQAAGHVVAMTGDGVNDAPALREAHIGIAMGKAGTDVAREAADMVLADDNFATIVDAIREGRSIYRNIQKFIFFLLSSNAGLVACVIVTSFLPKLPGLRPLMILWINLVTNGLPALALGIDPPEAGQMSEPPRKHASGLMSARDYLNMGVVGVVMGAAALACYKLPWTGVDAVAPGGAYPRAAAFSLLAISPLIHAFNCRSATRSLLTMRPVLPLPLLLALVVSGLIHLLAVLVPALQPVFQTFNLSARDWLVLLVLSAIIIPVMELTKIMQRRGVVGADMGPMSRQQ